MIRQFQDMFRPNYEVVASLGWFVAAIYILAVRPPLWPAMFVAVLAIAARRAWQAAKLYEFRISLGVARVEKMKVADLIALSRSMQAKHKSFWLGRGFIWSQRHAETARHIQIRNPEEIKGIPDWFPQRAMDFLSPKNTTLVKEGVIGVPWIHGMEPKEIDLGLPLEALPGHTGILGTTRTGKTRLYELLCTQIIHTMPDAALICIDPKGDKDWEDRLEKECKRTGRKFLRFHPAHPQKSIRINPLANWNNISEPATRIGQLIDADGSFAAFAWKTLYRVMRGQVAAGEKPDIKTTKRYVEQGIEPLLTRLLSQLFDEHDGDGWRATLSRYGKGKQVSDVEMMAAKYTDEYMPTGRGDEAMDGLVSMLRHSKEHYSKMVQVLEPILEMLGSGEIGAMLSPDPLDHTDTRPIYDTKRIIDEKAVLYIGLDSLSDKITGSAIASILLADIASVSGAIYNFEAKTNAYLMVDEAPEVLNDQAVQILNKGGGAGIKAFLAMQTLADMEARYASKPKAMMTLGNLNNIICLRLRDMDSAEYVSKMFLSTVVRTEATSYSSGSDSSSAFTEFRGGINRSLAEKDVPLVSPDVITRLPPLQFIALIAAQKTVKGRIPLLID